MVRPRDEIIIQMNTARRRRNTSTMLNSGFLSDPRSFLRRILSIHPQYKQFNAIMEQKPEYFGRRDEGFLFEMTVFLAPQIHGTL
jgi:hypothetical protein